MDQAVIFDMDGTLADTRKVTVPAIRAAAREFGLAEPPAERVAEAIGISGDAFYRAALPDAPEDQLSAIAARTFALETEIARRLGPELLFPGILDLLDALAAQGAPLAIASTGEEEHVASVLGVTGIRDRFAAIRCGHNDKTAMLRELRAALGGYALAMVGDKPWDSRAAANLGIPSVGAGWSFSTPAELEGFTVVVDTPGDVSGAIGAFGAGLG